MSTLLFNSRQGFQAGHEVPFSVKRVFHASGAVETLGHFLTRSPDSALFARPSVRRTGEALHQAGQGRDERSIRRTRKTFRYLMHSLAPDRMLTLTYRENMQDYDKAAADLDKFVRWLRKNYPSIPFVAVAEKQQRGAWHWHVALRDWVNIKKVRNAWKHGQVNIKRKVIGVSVGRAAGYLAKYLSKHVENVGRAAYKVYNRKYLTKAVIKKYILELRAEVNGLLPWQALTVAFTHLAAGSFCKDGIFWRIDYADELRYSNTQVRAHFGQSLIGA